MPKVFEFPETLPSKESQFATYIPARQPAFKVHSNEGLAHSALGQRGTDEAYAKYELKNGEWTLVYEHQPKDNCDQCKQPFTLDRWKRVSRNKPYNEKGPAWLQDTICDGCYNRQRADWNREQQEKRDRAELARLNAKYNN